MKKVLTLSLGLFLGFCLHAQDILIRDINLIPMTGNTVVKKQNVLIRDGKIQQIGSFTVPKDKGKLTIIEGKGKYLMPGLADMHVHLPEASRTDTLLLLNIAAGVTHIRVTNSKVKPQEIMQRLEQTPSGIRPGIYYSKIVTAKTDYSLLQFDSVMQILKKDRIDFIKLFSVASTETFDHLMQAAQKNGIIVCGHFPMYLQADKLVALPMEKVLASGFKSIEHLGGYDEINEEAVLQRAIQLTKQYKVYNCPTLDWDQMAFDQLYPEAYQNRLSYPLLPDRYIRNWEAQYRADVQEAGGAEKVIAERDKYRPTFEKKKKILKMLADQDCPLLIGGDATGNFQLDGFNVYEEMYNWSQAGLDNYTILKSATVSPAAFFNESDQWGTIETGKNADLVILDKNPLEDIRNITTIRSTLIKGKLYHKKELMAGL